MKKVILGALLLLSTLGFGQTIIYSENFGNSIIYPQVLYPINTFTGFQNTNVVYSGNSYITQRDIDFGSGNPYPSIGYDNSYTGASGGNYLRINSNDPNTEQIVIQGQDTLHVPTGPFIIKQIDISQYNTPDINTGLSQIGISFGFIKSNIVIYQSIDGINWSFLLNTQGYFIPPTSNMLFNNTDWNYCNITPTIFSHMMDVGFGYPLLNTNTLYLRFTGGGTYGIDDIQLKYYGNLSTNQNTLTDELKLYPNPTSGGLYLSTNTDKNIKIYDMIGNKVIDKDITNFLDTSNLSNGIYLCEITEGENKLINKIIKK